MTGQKPTRRVAVLLSSHQGASGWDRPAYRGAQVAFDALSADESLPCRLEHEVLDDHSDPSETVRLAARVVKDQSFVAVFGPTGSESALAAAPIFNTAGIAQVSPSAQHIALTRSGYRTFFRLIPNGEQHGTTLAEMARRYLGASTVAMVHDADTFGCGTRDIVVPAFQAIGGRVVLVKSIRRWDTDFADPVTELVRARPEVIIFAVHEAEGLLLSKALREAGSTATFLGTDAMKPTMFLWCGTGEGPYHTSICTDIARQPSARTFRDSFVARFPESSVYSAEGHDAVIVIAEALRRAGGGSDRGTLLDTVRALRNVAGASGPITFDAVGDRVDPPIGFYQVRDSRMSYLGTTAELLGRQRHTAIA